MRHYTKEELYALAKFHWDQIVPSIDACRYGYRKERYSDVYELFFRIEDPVNELKRDLYYVKIEFGEVRYTVLSVDGDYHTAHHFHEPLEGVQAYLFSLEHTPEETETFLEIVVENPGSAQQLRDFIKIIEAHLNERKEPPARPSESEREITQVNSVVSTVSSKEETVSDTRATATKGKATIENEVH